MIIQKWVVLDKGLRTIAWSIFTNNYIVQKISGRDGYLSFKQ